MHIESMDLTSKVRSIENTSPANNSTMNEIGNALETPKINESILAKLDKVGAHFKYV